jgi:membrane-bound inhibitor of C-type lysozyme
MKMKRKMGLLLGAAAVSTLTGCSSVDVWPFGEKAPADRTVPANLTEYQCAEGKRFFVRSIDQGAAMWVILADREFALQKTEGAPKYSNGVSTLIIADGVARLEESATSIYADCKVPEKKKD